MTLIKICVYTAIDALADTGFRQNNVDGQLTSLCAYHYSLLIQ